MCNAPRCGAEHAHDDGLGRRDGGSVTVTGTMDEGARWIIWMSRWQLAREVSVADAGDHRWVAGSKLCGPLAARYGEERQGGRRNGQGCGTWTRSVEPSSGEWAVLPTVCQGFARRAGACILSMVRGAFVVASDNAVAERAAGALCGVELVSVKVGGESQPEHLEGCVRAVV
jgi:hypothetical protein